MLPAQIFEVFRPRVHWSAMKVLLGACNIPVSLGWENTLKKILLNGEIKDEFVSNFDFLKEYYSHPLSREARGVFLRVLLRKGSRF